MDNLSFYVFDNLRLGAPGMPNESNLYRFSDLESAIEKFRELPDEITTALGCRMIY